MHTLPCPMLAQPRDLQILYTYTIVASDSQYVYLPTCFQMPKTEITCLLLRVTSFCNSEVDYFIVFYKTTNEGLWESLGNDQCWTPLRNFPLVFIMFILFITHREIHIYTHKYTYTYMHTQTHTYKHTPGSQWEKLSIRLSLCFLCYEELMWWGKHAYVTHERESVYFFM